MKEPIQSPHLLNGAALAYIGDAVYETYVRQHVLQQGKTRPNQLHRAAVKYVGAKAQAQIIQAWISQDDFLTQPEIDIYRRGRNHRQNTRAKNATIQDYRQATGFEALIGWLHLDGQTDRLKTLLQTSIDFIDQGGN